jgi:hypothetical protein
MKIFGFHTKIEGFHTISRFPNSTRVDITVYQHGKCFIFVKLTTKTRVQFLPEAEGM